MRLGSTLPHVGDGAQSLFLTVRIEWVVQGTALAPSLQQPFYREICVFCAYCHGSCRDSATGVDRTCERPCPHGLYRCKGLWFPLAALSPSLGTLALAKQCHPGLRVWELGSIQFGMCVSWFP